MIEESDDEFLEDQIQEARQFLTLNSGNSFIINYLKSCILNCLGNDDSSMSIELNGLVLEMTVNEGKEDLSE